MAHVISDECVSCGSCEGECPVGAISEGDGKYEIDADACVDCGSVSFFMSILIFRTGLELKINRKEEEYRKVDSPIRGQYEKSNYYKCGIG